MRIRPTLCCLLSLAAPSHHHHRTLGPPCFSYSPSVHPSLPAPVPQGELSLLYPPPPFISPPRFPPCLPPPTTQGELSLCSQTLVSGQRATEFGEFLGLHKWVCMGAYSMRDHLTLAPTVLADAFEALVGALHEDQVGWLCLLLACWQERVAVGGSWAAMVHQGGV